MVRRYTDVVQHDAPRDIGVELSSRITHDTRREISFDLAKKLVRDSFRVSIDQDEQ